MLGVYVTAVGTIARPAVTPVPLLNVNAFVLTVDAVKFGLDPNSILRIKDDRKQILKDAGVAEGACPRDPYLRAICESCSS